MQFPIFYCFRYITTYFVLPTQMWVEAITRGVPLGPRVWKLVSKKRKSLGLPDGEKCMFLRSLILTHYRHVTDRETDRLWMPPVTMSHS